MAGAGEWAFHPDTGQWWQPRTCSEMWGQWELLGAEGARVGAHRSQMVGRRVLMRLCLTLRPRGLQHARLP